MKYPEVLVSLFLLACIADECLTQEEQFGGPFRLIFNQFGHCDESGTHQIYMTSTRISKVSRTKYIYSTNMTTEIVISDAITVEFDVAKFGNGGWRPHFMQMEFPQLCTSLETMMPMLKNALVNALHAECPIPPGTYELGNLDIESIQIGQYVPNFPYGKYRADVSSLINGTLVGCLRCYIDAVPAKRSRPKKISKQSS